MSKLMLYVLLKKSVSDKLKVTNCQKYPLKLKIKLINHIINDWILKKKKKWW